MIDKAPSSEIMHDWVSTHFEKQTPVQQFDIKIDGNGQWFHEGSLIRRDKMVSLFASILTRLENGSYALVTPAEIGTIIVDDAPFIITQMDIENTGKDQIIHLKTSLGDAVAMDADHQIKFRKVDGIEKPYIIVRDRLEALINRSVYYELAEVSVVHDNKIGVWSSGLFHPLSNQLCDDDIKTDQRMPEQPYGN